jgi:hypothetical protein
MYSRESKRKFERKRRRREGGREARQRQSAILGLLLQKITGLSSFEYPAIDERWRLPAYCRDYNSSADS